VSPESIFAIRRVLRAINRSLANRMAIAKTPLAEEFSSPEFGQKRLEFRQLLDNN
jgi:hypothetical protein